MTSPELVLQKAAEDGSLDPAEWPQTLQYILDRLDEIINDFPKPAHSTDPSSSTPAQPQPAVSSQDSAAGDKENAAPTTPTRPPVPTFSTEAGAIPQDTVNAYSSIRNQLAATFAQDAPHTIQRLAELILEPKRRYRFLPPYLRALDRIVSVSSPNALFPLPQAVLNAPSGLLNGTSAQSAAALGSDESLGGALLTPIPWLQSRGAQNELISESTEIVDGPNGAGRIETVTVAMLNGSSTSPTRTSPPSSSAISQIASSHPDGETLPSTGAVTQGEILRQEQEAGVVLNNPHSLTGTPHRTVSEADPGPAVVDTVEPEEESPHARGPEIIGMEDTGPQKSGGSLDIEGAVGRPSLERSSKSPGPPSTATDSKDEEMEDATSDKKGEQDKKEKGKGKPDEEMKSDE
ncbi:hypothetical protein P280DRAFT_471334 [Massarina eburnea CBS 473.64]|uniref:PPP4R2-domain-containing protein n=1 Tax=Massarina eburnea CBS 473.64 TaxID=1395130 RepID=A0A6A6RRW5_9PLEO|nr:hypothetical protein P280DRAFT_471334 [Massarina eburnea CBS 473.64]